MIRELSVCAMETYSKLFKGNVSQIEVSVLVPGSSGQEYDLNCGHGPWVREWIPTEMYTAAHKV